MSDRILYNFIFIDYNNDTFLMRFWSVGLSIGKNVTIKKREMEMSNTAGLKILNWLQTWNLK